MKMESSSLLKNPWHNLRIRHVKTLQAGKKVGLVVPKKTTKITSITVLVQNNNLSPLLASAQLFQEHGQNK